MECRIHIQRRLLDRAEAKPVAAPVPEITFTEGQVVHHPAFGDGKISAINGDYLKVQFDCGEKILGAKWVTEKCGF